MPFDGNIIKREWLRFYDQVPPAGPSDLIVQSWDVAMMTGAANDYSVCTTWCIIQSDYYLIDVFRGRLMYPDLRRKVVELAGRSRAETVVIEKAGPGMSLLQDLRFDTTLAMPSLIGQKPDGSKVDRMAAQSAKIEGGHVLFPQQADWLDNLLLELLGFPFGRHDDQVDSISQFLKWATVFKDRDESSVACAQYLTS